MKIALLCSGLGNVSRGHEAFARDLFELIGDVVDITLFKGGGTASERERVVDHIPRNTTLLNGMHVEASAKWASAAIESERIRIEGETFAYAALKPLLEGAFDIIHCLEQEVCNVVYAHRHLFARIPKIVFSNGGAIPANRLPHCDFVQEHTAHNLAYSAKGKSFMIPHGVDVSVFRPGLATDFRATHGIPPDALVVISVGTICYWHKRMDHVIRETSRVPGAYLVIVGQENRDTAEIKRLGHELMEERIIFATLPRDELPRAYAAADVFTLGSLFETFGIVYIEAMATGLPVICTDHPNQRSIVGEGRFIDMKKTGELTRVLTGTSRGEWAELGRRSRERAVEHYSLESLRRRYVDQYRAMAGQATHLPRYTLKRRLFANVRNAWRRTAQLIHGQAE